MLYQEVKKLIEQSMIKIQAEANVPTEHGTFRMIAFSENENDWMPHMAIVAENTDFQNL
jgi:GTP cyclohydrolase II